MTKRIIPLKRGIKTHGLSKTSEYKTWKGMRYRCTNPNEPNYKYYGGRGISVCDRWQRFENFILDMGKRPTPKHTIERVDNDGNYTPENCEWATKTTQSRNKRNNRVITHDGKTMCMSEWAEYLGIRYDLINTRINTQKWPIKKALTEPVNPRYLRK